MKQSVMFNFDHWRFIDTGTGSGAWNMAVDEALLELCATDGRPTLRVYGWELCVSVGRFSQIDQTLSPEMLKVSGMPIVRRITGGGVLVHGDDLSYSLIVPRTAMEEAGVKENYRHWCRFLIRLYEGLGFEARFASEEGSAVQRSAVCLAGLEPLDLLIEGKKIGGNAQRHTRVGFLQHGSIPITLNEERFASLFVQRSGINEAASLHKLGCSITPDELKKSVCDAFSEAYGVGLSHEPLNEKEIARAMELVERKYGRKEWNHNGHASLSQA